MPKRGHAMKPVPTSQTLNEISARWQRNPPEVFGRSGTGVQVNPLKMERVTAAAPARKRGG